MDGPKALIKPFLSEVCQQYYDNVFAGGHSGKYKTAKTLQQTYYWCGMQKGILEYLKLYDIFQQIHYFEMADIFMFLFLENCQRSYLKLPELYLFADLGL